MSMKKFDLAKSIGLKVAGQMKVAGVPGRFAQDAHAPLDKREQRKRDAALGLVPFACKLPSDLVKRLNERAEAHEGGITALLIELLGSALGDEPAVAPVAAEPAVQPAAKKAAAKAAATPASEAAPAAVKAEPVAKKAAAKATPGAKPKAPAKSKSA